MLREFIDRILEISDEPVVRLGDGREMKKAGFGIVETPKLSPFNVLNLSALAAFVKTSIGRGEFLSKSLRAVVTGPGSVSVVSDANPPTFERHCLVTAAVAGYFEPFKFGVFMPTENFIIALKSLFMDTKPARDLVRLVGNMKSDSSLGELDDGFGQTVETRAGVHLRATEELPNPITLAPFRTFPEVRQPESLFLIRARAGAQGRPELALFEADGGAWKVEAIKAIRDFLISELPEIPIIG